MAKVLRAIKCIKNVSFPGPGVVIQETMSNPSPQGHTLEWKPDGSVICRHPRKGRFIEIPAATILFYEWEDVAEVVVPIDANVKVASK